LAERTPAELKSEVPEPKQERSRATLERIVRAAKELIAERGYDTPSIAEISERAGCSVGGFYARFPDRDALFRFIDQREFEEATECWRAFLQPDRWKNVSAAELVTETLRGMEVSYRDARPLLRALNLHWRNAPARPELRSAAAAHYETVYGWYGDLLAERQDEFTHPDPHAAAAFILRLAESTLTEWIVFADSQLVPADQEQIEEQLEELRAACLRYLGVDELPDSTDRRRRTRTEAQLI
jgi:AcrR family transcriptional regulator